MPEPEADVETPSLAAVPEPEPEEIDRAGRGARLPEATDAILSSASLPDYVIDEPDEVPPVVVPEPEPEPDLSGPLPEFVVETNSEPVRRPSAHAERRRRRKWNSVRSPTT